LYKNLYLLFIDLANMITTLLYTAVLSSSFKFTCRFSYADKPTVCHYVKRRRQPVAKPRSSRRSNPLNTSLQSHSWDLRKTDKNVG